MKKHVQRVLFLFSFLVFAFLTPIAVNAESELSLVDSEAVLNADGSIDITQDWFYDDRDTDGTEHYIHMNTSYRSDVEVGEEFISDYSVLRNGQVMVMRDDWNINDSFSYKTDHYGYVRPEEGDGVELTFGISEHTENMFTVKYTIHNAIKETTDGFKYLHWSFVPTELEPAPDSLKATIESAVDGVSFDKIYGFNYEGFVEFDDDEIRDKVNAEMTGRYSDGNHLNVFVLLDDAENKISGTYPVSKSLTDKVEDMFEGSDYDLEDFDSEQSGQSETVKQKFGIKSVLTIIGGFLAALFAILFNNIFIALFVIGFMYPIYKVHMKRSSLMNKLSDDERREMLSKDFYRRDEPDLEVAFYPTLTSIVNFGESTENIVTYYISKWTNEGVFEYVKEVDRETKGIFKKETKTDILFELHDELTPDDVNDIESKIFLIFHRLADEDGILNTKDLAKLDVESIEEVITNHRKVFAEQLVAEGYVEKKEKATELTNSGVNLLKQHLGLRNYLRDYTLINEREASEIELWDYYFRLAALYGIADTFRKQLDQLPSMSPESKEVYNRYYGSSGTARMNYMVANNVSRQIQSVQSQRQRSSGGGGSSSSGGGGGFSGGGSGGGTR